MSGSCAPEAVRGFVLAGGLSTRMGRDKATLEHQGRAFVVHALERMANVVPEPRIVGTRPDLGVYAPVVSDRHPGIGPLGGLEAALHGSDADLNLFLPVDLPGLPVRFLSGLIERARLTGAVATVPLLNGMPQPLAAVYRRALLPLLEEAIGRQEYKVMRLIEKTKNLPGRVDFFHVEMFPERENGWPYRWFRNVNSPQDLQALQC